MAVVGTLSLLGGSSSATLSWHGPHPASRLVVYATHPLPAISHDDVWLPRYYSLRLSDRRELRDLTIRNGRRGVIQKIPQLGRHSMCFGKPPVHCAVRTVLYSTGKCEHDSAARCSRI